MSVGVEVQATVSKAISFLSKCEALVITAGAGMGVDSGLPDFRGQDGFWKAYPPFQKLNLSFYDLARPEWFQNDPLLAWGFYGHRANLYRRITPHAGFTKLLEFSKKLKYGSFVVTSNVDGHFQKAGFPEERVVEVHGSISHLQCCDGCDGEIIPLPESHHFEIDESTFRLRTKDNIPPCPVKCGNLCRPNILMFGDWGWISSRTDDQSFRFDQWIDSLPRDVTLAIIEMGAGKAVPTIRYQSENLFSKFTNSAVLRINPRDSDFPSSLRKKANAFSLPLPALQGLELLGL